MLKNALNNFELSILEKISVEYPFLKSHVPFLRIRSRQRTGVGMYAGFLYADDIEFLESIPARFSHLSSNSVLRIEGLKYGLSYEIAITNGRMDFLEVVANEEDWDGQHQNFWFE